MSHTPIWTSFANRIIGAALSLTLGLAALTGNGRPQQSSEMRKLAPNQTVEGEITGAETHQYTIHLQKGEFFQVRVEQKGVDVTIKLVDANGSVLAMMDSPNGKEGPETLTFVAAQSASYILEVRGFDAAAGKGKYTILREVSRMATAQDWRRVEVEHAFAEAMAALRADDLMQTAITKLEKVLLGWQELNDGYMAELTIQRIKGAKSTRAKMLYEVAKKLANQRTGEAVHASLALFDEARRLTKMINDEKGEVICLMALGEVNSALGKKTEALAYYQQALALLKDKEELEEEASVLDSLGRICIELQQNQRALEYFNRDLSVYRSLKNKAGEAMALGNIGAAYIYLGEKQKAIDFFTQALSLYRTLNNPKGEARVLTGLGRAYSDMDQDERAQKFYTQALPLSKSSGDQSGEAQLLVGLGAISSEKEERQKALDFYLQSVSLYQRLGDKNTLAETLSKIGFVYLSLGDKPKAVESFLQSLTIERDLQHKEDQVRTLSYLSALSADLGEKEKAIEYDKQALAICVDRQDKTGEAIFLNNIGMVYLAMGEDQMARKEYFDKALLIFNGLRHKEGLAWTHDLLGASYIDSSDYQKQLEHFNQSLILYRDIRNKKKEADTLNSIASVYGNLEQKEKAIELYKQVLTLNADNSAALHNISNTYADLGEHQKVFEYRIRSLVLSLSEGKDSEAVALYAMSDVLRSLGNLRLSIFYGKQAVNKYQELREVIRGLDYETQKSFLRRIDFAYKILAESLIEEGRAVEAVHVLNLYRDQQFFDFNRGTDKPVKPLSISPYEASLASRYEHASRKVSEIGLQIWDLKRRAADIQLGPEAVARRAQLEAEFKDAVHALTTMIKDTQTESSKIAAEQDLVPEATDVDELQKALAQIREAAEPTSVALYTLVGTKKFYLLLITPETIKAFNSSIKFKEFSDKVLLFHNLLSSADYDARPLGKQLYDIIIKPIESELKKTGAQTLLWSLDGNLRYVPMAALSPDGKGYFVEHYQNVVFTRTDRERMTPGVSANWRGTGFGSSRALKIKLPDSAKPFSFCELPGVKAEMQAIFRTDQRTGGILTGEVFTDAQFTQTRFYEEMKKKRPLVHISSHFLFWPGDDSHSFLVMGDGTALTLSEMKKHSQLFDGVELLTLSACNTAAQLADADGREIDGFAELAQRLGAGAVLASLWSVSDNTTPHLMSDFYRLRQSPAGTTKAEALRKAQLTLLNGTAHIKAAPRQFPCVAKGVSEAVVRIVSVPPGGKRSDGPRRDTNEIYVDQKDAPPYIVDKAKPFAHPYYWAPFVLFGNWR